jgi:hypothetical protein
MSSTANAPYRLFVWAISTMILVYLGTPPTWAQVDHSQQLDRYLSIGQLEKSAQFFARVCEEKPQDHQARLALGLTRFLQAIERFCQSGFRYGMISGRARQIPFLRLPVPLNPDPESLSYQEWRAMITQLESDLQHAETTLAKVETSNLQLDFFIGRVQLDLDADGAMTPQETLWRVFSAVNPGVDQQVAERFYVRIDGADVHWLRGYCNVLLAICDFLLAYDQQNLFERCGHLIFQNVDSPFRIAPDPDSELELYELALLSDVIASIHLMNFKLVEPDRMKSAHAHLLTMIALSRQCWEEALAETDNHREWIPNPNQDSVLQLRVSRELVTGWSSVLDELESILAGEKLIPYWRKYQRSLFSGVMRVPDTGTGVNFKRFLLEPTDFDLILTIQGTQVEPYLEEGPLSTPQAWGELTRVFRGQFFGFAIWFN